jgi:hypothetical protein
MPVATGTAAAPRAGSWSSTRGGLQGPSCVVARPTMPWKRSPCRRRAVHHRVGPNQPSFPP